MSHEHADDFAQWATDFDMGTLPSLPSTPADILIDTSTDPIDAARKLDAHLHSLDDDRYAVAHRGLIRLSKQYELNRLKRPVTILADKAFGIPEPAPHLRKREITKAIGINGEVRAMGQLGVFSYSAYHNHMTSRSFNLVSLQLYLPHLLDQDETLAEPLELPDYLMVPVVSLTDYEFLEQ